MTVSCAIFLLVAVHFLLDFPLQGEAVAVQKSRHVDNELAKFVPWPYWMAAHALSHALGVFVVTASLPLAIMEACAHFAIDFGKCERWYSIHVDQALHVLCKVLWVGLLWYGVV